MKNILFVALAIAGFSCTQPLANAQSRLNAGEFATLLEKDKTVQLVDVRTPEEYNAGHIQGARLMDYYASDFATQIAKLDKEKPVLVYCAAGGRSNSAAVQLTKMGYKKVYDLTGGIRAWQSSGKPTVKVK